MKNKDIDKLMVKEGVIKPKLKKDSKSDLLNRKFQINFKGDFSFLNKSTIKKINDLQSQNPRSHQKLIIYINYSGKDDILNAYNRYFLSKSNQRITDKLIKGHLYSKNIPDPDILIRTGGYQRISDFMLYQISFTELMFTKKLWPDLNKTDIDKFIYKYKKIERKFGL